MAGQSGEPVAGHSGQPVAADHPVAAAVLPHPPLLVPELAGAAAAELDPLRAACHKALAAVLGAADVTVVVGDGPVWGVPDPAAAGSFRPYGADVEVTLPALINLDLPGLPPPARLGHLPLSLAVAAYLLATLDPPPARLAAVTVPGSLGQGAAAAIGRTLTAAAQDLGTAGLVVMADLSACRTELAPGAFREEAAGFDASVAEAFRSGNPAPLLGLDPAQAADLLVTGRVPLQALAGAFAARPAAGGERSFDGGGRVDGDIPEAAGSGTGGEVPMAGDPPRRGLVSADEKTRLPGRASFTGGPDAPDGGPFEGDPALRGQVLYDAAPYGVGYLVALLTATTLSDPASSAARPSAMTLPTPPRPPRDPRP